ncbi:fumarylacetoacetate hydrolase family protein [Streptomyces sp. cf386]|uniref:fumarylacetoacetate hydrolase family protein n=1 Tax=Streptomyces sp. cf386 TaxID=1761904 RepID=UPI0035245C51
MDPATVPLTFFRKTSGSITGPYDEIVKPAHVRFLDYENELGLVVGRPLEVGATVIAANWKDHIAGLVVTNDVSTAVPPWTTCSSRSRSPGSWPTSRRS